MGFEHFFQLWNLEKPVHKTAIKFCEVNVLSFLYSLWTCLFHLNNSYFKDAVKHIYIERSNAVIFLIIIYLLIK